MKQRNLFGFHCRHIERYKAAAMPCDGVADVIWRDADGVRHGYCDAHLTEGYSEAERRGWTLDAETEEAAA